MDGEPTDVPTRTATEPAIASRYRLVERLGWGGFAEVWSATDEVLNRRVAVKRLLPHLVDDPASVARFRREAMALARVNHPGVVAVFDTVTRPGYHAIVMELVDGGTLRDRLDRDGVLDPTGVVELGIQLFDALDAAHRHGLVHRDVAPANLLIGHDGAIRLTDFGIATSDDRTHTMVGGVAGTCAYLAPEQVSGGVVDHRADIYGAGAVLYEAACGAPPFVRSTDVATMLARLRDDVVDPRDLRPALPDPVAEILLRCLARSPDERPRHAADVATVFRGIAASLRRPTPSLAVGSLVGPAGSSRTRVEAASTVASVTDADAGPSRATTEPAGIRRRVAPIDQRDRPVRRTRKPERVRTTDGPPPASGGATVPPPAGSGHPRRPPRSARRGGVVLATTLLVTGSGLLVVALVGHRGTADAPPLAPVESVASLDIAAVTTLDPQGTGRPGENDASASHLVDGDPATSWTTERYRDQHFGTKAGVGIALTLPRDAALVQLTITSRSTGWRAEVSASADVPTGVPSPGRVVDGSTGTVVVDLRGMRGRVITLWITQLADGADGHRVEWSEIQVTGRV